MSQTSVSEWVRVEVRNCLLAVISSWMRAAPRDRVKTILMDISNLDDIKAAKTALVTAFTKEELEKVVGEVKISRQGENAMKNAVEDIVKIVGAMKDQNCVPVFLAADSELDKYNKVVVLDTDPQLVGPRLKSLEDQMKELKQMLSDKLSTENRVDKMLSEQRQFSDIVRQPTLSLSSQMKRGSAHLGVPQQDKKRQKSTTEEDENVFTSGSSENNSGKDNVFSSEWQIQDSLRRGFTRQKNGNNQVTGNSSQQVNKSQLGKNGQEQQQGNNTLNKNKRPIQWGRGNKEGGARVEARAAPFDVFVCNTHNETTEEMVKDALHFYTSDSDGQEESRYRI